jgi:hypothetical protein
VLVCRRAASCLIEPEPGDLVLVAGDGREHVYILAVLERAGDGPARLSVEGDLAIQVRRGHFSVSSSHGIDLVTATDVKIAGSGLDVRAERGRVFLAELSYIGGKILAQAERVKLLAGIFDSVLERFAQKVKRSYRVVEEMDHLRSGQISYRAEKNMDLRARNALLTAEELVKLDGDQIHLG